MTIFLLIIIRFFTLGINCHQDNCISEKITDITFYNTLKNQQTIDIIKDNKIIKNKGKIKIKIDNEKIINFTDCIYKNNEIKNKSYKYLGFSHKTNSYVIQIAHYESSEFMLINKSGSIIHTWSIPYISTNNELISLSKGIEYEVYNNGFQVFQLKNNIFYKKCNVIISNLEPTELRWIGKHAFALKLQDPNHINHSKSNTEYRIYSLK